MHRCQSLELICFTIQQQHWLFHMNEQAFHNVYLIMRATILTHSHTLPREFEFCILWQQALQMETSVPELGRQGDG